MTSPGVTACVVAFFSMVTLGRYTISVTHDEN